MAKVTKTFQYGQHQVTLETGEVARQASGAVVVRMADTVVLVTAVGNRNAKEGMDFFPLTVDYLEKFYAGGRIPGGFFKREGRQTERETLTSRLIDRPIRPLFPEGFRNEVQVIATVMSLNPEVGGDIPALIGASAALALSGIPFAGPIGAAKVGYANGQYLLNPPGVRVPDPQQARAPRRDPAGEEGRAGRAGAAVRSQRLEPGRPVEGIRRVRIQHDARQRAQDQDAHRRP